MSDDFHPLVRHWFAETFEAPTPAQTQAWPVIHSGANALILAPTGSGKTLAAFLVALNRILFDEPLPTETPGVRTLYISPLKALGVDVERNLRRPLAGLLARADNEHTPVHVPTISVRSGDTPPRVRQRMLRQPPDILITTPESLYLILTSKARDILATVETVIIDEIHSVVSTKRGAHLFLSLERLERLRRDRNSDIPPLQRVGLSATQRPLAEVARLLGGAEATADPDIPVHPRPVEIIEAGRSRQLELRIEMPLQELTAPESEPAGGTGTTEDAESVPSASEAGPIDPAIASIWPPLHRRLLELIGQHRTTMIFVNNRRLTERLAAAINELAEEEIAAAHHGSLAHEQRQNIEERLKQGDLPAIVATSSLELGIDMGAVDLVVQIESPPSIAAGVQRIGRSGHQVGAASRGVIFPKFRGDLLACGAAARRMQAGEVEETFYPRNPLDVLAQQVVAMAALEPVSLDDIYATVRSAAPFAELSRTMFDGVLDLLSGRYPSDEFSELRPRITWDRLTGEIAPRRGTQRLAILNAGTIPDRGLYGVYLAEGTEGRSSRVGELDEEMVFELRAGEVFLLGASSWRVISITHDRVLVMPAPGEPGKMPFWRGDRPGRPLEFGRAIGELARQLTEVPREQALAGLISDYAIDSPAAETLLDYLHDQAEATGAVPGDRTIVVESFLDDVDDWRVLVMTPFGERVHAPWAMAVAARLRHDSAGQIDMMWHDDGMVFRLPGSETPPAVEQFFPTAAEIHAAVVEELGTTALFAARFRENAARALLLPRNLPGRRTPLWLQRRKSADLLNVAARYERFPILLETYRECLSDVFDMQGVKSILQAIERQEIEIMSVRTDGPSPFANTLLFEYTGNFLYNGDAPLAERRAASLALDHSQLQELLGQAELRQLLDPRVIDEVAGELQRLNSEYPVRDADGLHEMLLQLGPLSRGEIIDRCEPLAAESGACDDWFRTLQDQRRIIEVPLAGERRLAAAEDAARFRDALGVDLPSGLPPAFLEPVAEPLIDLVSRHARTHVPFHTEEVARRFGLEIEQITAALRLLAERGRVIAGEFLPEGTRREWCDTGVLRRLKSRSLARLREQIQPVSVEAFTELLIDWQGIARPRRGLDGLLDSIEQLQGLPLALDDWERHILPSRVSDFSPHMLDELAAAGEIVWQGTDNSQSGDGRIMLYLTDHAPQLTAVDRAIEADLDQRIVDLLASRGGLFFDEIHQALHDFPQDVLEQLWRLVRAGHVTNDTLAPLRSLLRTGKSKQSSSRRRERRGFRSRRLIQLAGSEGRWSLLRGRQSTTVTLTEHQTAVATRLLERYGVVTREAISAEGVPGGFAGLYPVFKAMEESGRIRRGYFVAGQGAAQFAAAGAVDRLRRLSQRRSEDEPEYRLLAACDPANPYGAALKWPESVSDNRPQRVPGARVILCEGHLLGYLNRSRTQVLRFFSDETPQADRWQQVFDKALEAAGGRRVK